MIKKWLSLTLAACFMLALASCSAGKPSSNNAGSSVPASASASASASPASVSDLPVVYAQGGAPLTGLPISEQAATQRPLAVMVDNSASGMPQRGIAAADVLLEMPIENGQSRLMALYSDYSTVPQVGPVRPIADQFVQFILPINAIAAHIDSTSFAHNLLNVTNYKTINGFSTGTSAFFFDAARSQPKPSGKKNEFCWFTDAAALWRGMEKIDVITTGARLPLFIFSETPPKAGTDAFQISVYYNTSSSTGFAFDETTSLYNKTMLDVLHTDESGTPLSFNNVILLNTAITTKEDDYHMPEFDMQGGDGFYFAAGHAQSITWTKGNPISPLILLDATGAPLALQQGKTYLGFAPQNADAPSVVFGPKV